MGCKDLMHLAFISGLRDPINPKPSKNMGLLLQLSLPLSHVHIALKAIM